MNIPTEPIGSIPRPPSLIAAIDATGDASHLSLESLYQEAIRDTIRQFEATGSPVITDGEQRKHRNFRTYAGRGLPNTREALRDRTRADADLKEAMHYTATPLKQAVVSPSALSLMYPEQGIVGYSREEFVNDLLNEHVSEVRRCLDLGAHCVQIDFTEGQLAIKLDPSGSLLSSFIDLNNLALARFSAEDRKRIGVHICAGSDRNATDSADLDYAELLPSLFQLQVGNFYIALAGEKDRARVLKIVRQFMKSDVRVFVGVISPRDPRVETAEEVRDRVLEAAEYIPAAQLGTTDDCGFAPFGNDTTTSREAAFAKIRARVAGTVLAAKRIGSR